ncbi:MAG: helix-turn-helix transcriptional regulator [Clostridia bacterium]|nr:helix-turn-helix transcriptional regulator [Clostridia bacterium]
MTLGEKIKAARKQKKLTQAAICENKITRNMLSAIERGRATPSLDTVRYLAMRLELPISYLLSDDENLCVYQKNEKIRTIRTYLGEKQYKKCISLIESISEYDDELSYILACCYFELGKEAVLYGSLASGKDFLALATKYASKTVYDTSRIEALGIMYMAIAKNITAPVLELDTRLFEKKSDNVMDLELYRYILQDKTHVPRTPAFEKHIRAKAFLKERRYEEALSLMKEIEGERHTDAYNAYFYLNLYADIELCYKQLADFENAYKYSTKRLALIDRFKT